MELIKNPTKQYLVDPIKPHISYPFECPSNIEILEEQIEQLTDCGVAEQQSINDAHRNREHINEDVIKRLSSGENEIPKEAKKCFVGLCPNLKTCYQLSKKTQKKALTFPKLQIVEPSVYSPEALPSRVLILNQVMDALKNPHLNIIGIYGMGGVGKTTLAKEVHREAIEDELFDVVVMVAVCQTTKLRRIQAEIADLLGLEFDVEEDERGRTSRLYERLKNSKVLIILDNIWEKIDLRSIGIPLGHECTGCKLLLTSMRRDVFWEMRTQKEFSLEVLREEEAWILFQMTLADAKDAELQAIATEVANKCAGLPLLIIIVATYLKDKGLYAWRDTLKQLSDFGDEELHEKVHKVLKSSYENLPSNEVKSFFLLCALFGQSNIPVNLLLTYAMGLGLFRNIVSVQDARDRLYQIIEKLKTKSLLLDGDMNGYVKMHDLVLHFVLSITTKKQYPFFGVRHRLREWPTEDCTRIALPYYDFDELPQGLKYPKAELFSLFSKDFNLKVPDLFFKDFRKLKVLNLTDMRFWSLPTSLQFLTNLHSLYLHGCWLEDVAIVGDLKHLEFLSFSGSRIVKLPRQISQLSKLKLLDLSNCTHLQVIPTNVLSKLSLLEELYMSNSFARWDVDGNASVMELEELCQLTILEMQIIDAKRIPKCLLSKGLQRYRILIGNGCIWDGTHKISRTLQLKLQENIDMENELKELLTGIETLYLDEVRGIENRLYDIDGEGCQRLKHLHIGNNDDIQHIIDPTIWASCCAFPILETLSLDNLNSLEEICHGQLAAGSFSKLQILKISGCLKLKNLFSYSFAKCLLQLQEMEVKDCANMEAIINEGIEEMEFTQLYSLRLINLPRLTSIFSEMVFYPNLTSLRVENCESLKYIFKTSIIKSLLQLKRLKICDCKLMEEIILTEEFEEEMTINEIIFPSLDFLRLIKLSNLIRFSSGYPIIFQSLTEIEIRECFEFKNFVSNISNGGVTIGNSFDTQSLFNEMVTFFNLQIMKVSDMNNVEYLWHNQLVVDSFCKLKLLTIQHCSKLLAVFSSNILRSFQRLETLSLSYCPKIEQIYQFEGFNSTEVLGFELTHLRITYMPSLKQIWSDYADGRFSFRNLKSVEAYDCNVLEYVFPESVALGLLKLENLQIRSCWVKHIVGKPKRIEPDGDEPSYIFHFPELSFLLLENLKEIRRFCAGKHISECPKLKYMEVSGHDKAMKLGVEISNREGLHIFAVPQPFLLLQKVIFNNLQIMKVSDMNNLEYLWHSQLIADSFYKLKSLTVQRCSKLLTVFSSNVLRNFKRLKTLNLSYCPQIEEIYQFEGFNPIEVVEFELKHLSITYMPSLKQIWSDNADGRFAFRNLKSVEAYDCNVLEYVFPESLAFGLMQLENLQIRTCWVEHIVGKPKSVEPDDEEHTYVFDFPKLSFLLLENLKKIRSFCGGKHTSVCPKLRYMEVSGHDKAVKLGAEISNVEGLHIIAIPQPLRLLQKVAIPNLEKLRIEWDFIEHGDNGPHFLPRLKVIEVVSPFNSSPNTKKLVLSEFLSEEIIICALSIGKDNHYETLPCLRKVILSEMPYLKHVVHIDDTLTVSVFQNLQVLKVWECNRLKTLVSSLVSFKNLTFLQVSKCDGLITLITTSTAKSLVQLKKLYVGRCKKLQEIVELELDGEEGDIGFSQLEYLVLDDLPCLTSFCSSHNTFDFPCLEEVFVIKCPKMKMFAQVLNTPKLSQVQTGGKEYEREWEDNLNNTIQALFMKWRDRGTAIKHEFRTTRKPGILINVENQKINHMQWIRSPINPNLETLRLDGKEKVSRTLERPEIIQEVEDAKELLGEGNSDMTIVSAKETAWDYFFGPVV